MENAVEVGNYLLTEFKQLAGRYKCIGDVRGRGLFVGIDLVKVNVLVIIYMNCVCKSYSNFVQMFCVLIKAYN